MTRLYLFADETGNFDLRPGHGATRWFGVGTMLLDEGRAAALRAVLHDLRIRLAWDLMDVESGLHASHDPWPVRLAVLGAVAASGGRVDVTLIDKRTSDAAGASDTGLYRAAWHAHLRRLAPALREADGDVMVVASQVGTKKRRVAFRTAVEDAVAQSGTPATVAFWPNASDPCLWAADYCVWAVGRRWERNDLGPYGLIAHRIGSIWVSGVVFDPKQDTPPD